MFFSPVDTPNAPNHAHAYTSNENLRPKTPTENNNPEENPEEVKYTNPQTTHHQPNGIPQTTQPIITAHKIPPPPNTYP